jgi:hypothetical protein
MKSPFSYSEPEYSTMIFQQKFPNSNDLHYSYELKSLIQKMFYYDPSQRLTSFELERNSILLKYNSIIPNNILSYIFELLSSLNSKTKEFDQLKTNYSTCQLQKEKLQSEIKHLKEKSIIVKRENINLKNENSKLKEENIKLNDENSKLKVSNTRLQKEIQQLQQLNSNIQNINQKNDQNTLGVEFVFTNEQKEQVAQWKSIKIVCEDFQIINEQLAILKPEINTILIHPRVCSFVHIEVDYFIIGCFEEFKMQSIEIPNTIVSLGDSCFSKCISLTQISLPYSITSLDKGCFSKCSSLAQISLPDSITSLGDGCFSECSSLIQICLPNSMKSIGKYCFFECRNLTHINRPIFLVDIGKSVFYGCDKLKNKQIWEEKYFEKPWWK